MGQQARPPSVYQPTVRSCSSGRPQALPGRILGPPRLPQSLGSTPYRRRAPPPRQKFTPRSRSVAATSRSPRDVSTGQRPLAAEALRKEASMEAAASTTESEVSEMAEEEDAVPPMAPRRPRGQPRPQPRRSWVQGVHKEAACAALGASTAQSTSPKLGGSPALPSSTRCPSTVGSQTADPFSEFDTSSVSGLSLAASAKSLPARDQETSTQDLVAALARMAEAVRVADGSTLEPIDEQTTSTSSTADADVSSKPASSAGKQEQPESSSKEEQGHTRESLHDTPQAQLAALMESNKALLQRLKEPSAEGSASAHSCFLTQSCDVSSSCSTAGNGVAGCSSSVPVGSTSCQRASSARATFGPSSSTRLFARSLAAGCTSPLAAGCARSASSYNAVGACRVDCTLPAHAPADEASASRFLSHAALSTLTGWHVPEQSDAEDLTKVFKVSEAERRAARRWQGVLDARADVIESEEKQSVGTSHHTSCEFSQQPQEQIQLTSATEQGVPVMPQAPPGQSSRRPGRWRRAARQLEQRRLPDGQPEAVTVTEATENAHAASSPEVDMPERTTEVQVSAASGTATQPSTAQQQLQASQPPEEARQMRSPEVHAEPWPVPREFHPELQLPSMEEELNSPSLAEFNLIEPQSPLSVRDLEEARADEEAEETTGSRPPPEQVSPGFIVLQSPTLEEPEATEARSPEQAAEQEPENHQGQHQELQHDEDQLHEALSGDNEQEPESHQIQDQEPLHDEEQLHEVPEDNGQEPESHQGQSQAQAQAQAQAPLADSQQFPAEALHEDEQATESQQSEARAPLPEAAELREAVPIDERRPESHQRQTQAPLPNTEQLQEVLHEDGEPNQSITAERTLAFSAVKRIRHPVREEEEEEQEPASPGSAVLAPPSIAQVLDAFEDAGSAEDLLDIFAGVQRSEESEDASPGQEPAMRGAL
eukprot:TRINITY_DN35872_c0_g2_i1.p1 TRINITY_DN35872_c0_g2~~TRINITY_DN35872_c0_g2_i1.p1  ORF type:complete len:1054 (+),score=264.96 TRINITY_DN35872_c0_g2_i1:342-3164(+)